MHWSQTRRPLRSQSLSLKHVVSIALTVHFCMIVTNLEQIVFPFRQASTLLYDCRGESMKLKWDQWGIDFFLYLSSFIKTWAEIFKYCVFSDSYLEVQNIFIMSPREMNNTKKSYLIMSMEIALQIAVLWQCQSTWNKKKLCWETRCQSHSYLQSSKHSPYFPDNTEIWIERSNTICSY